MLPNALASRIGGKKVKHVIPLLQGVGRVLIPLRLTMSPWMDIGLGGYTTKTDDRRTIKSADFMARFYRSIFSAKFEQVLLLNLSPKYRPIKSGDKIGRVTYKSRPIVCRLMKSADIIGRFYRSSVIGLSL